MPRFLPDKAGGATGKSLIVLDPRLSLNQRVPGSSPGAPTKSNKALAMIEHQNGSFSLEIGMIRLNFGETTWFDALCLCPLFFRTFTPRDTARG